MVLRDAQPGDRAALVRDLVAAAFEVRAVLIGNFAKNEVLNYCDYTIHGSLKNADYIDAHGLTCCDSTMHGSRRH